MFRHFFHSESAHKLLLQWVSARNRCTRCWASGNVPSGFPQSLFTILCAFFRRAGALNLFGFYHWPTLLETCVMNVVQLFSECHKTAGRNTQKISLNLSCLAWLDLFKVHLYSIWKLWRVCRIMTSLISVLGKCLSVRCGEKLAKNGKKMPPNCFQLFLC